MTVPATPPQQVRFPWGPLTALYSAITFFMLGLDMALLHFGYRHYHFMAIMPVAFCLVATVASVFTAFSPRLRQLAWVTGVLAMVIGLVGTVIHLEIAFGHAGSLTWAVVMERLVFAPRPPLAPAALAGTGLLLIFVTMGEYWPVPWLERPLARLAEKWPFMRACVDPVEAAPKTPVLD